MPNKQYKCLIIPQNGAKPYLTDWMEMTLENIWETLETTYYRSWDKKKILRDILFYECQIANAICHHPRWRGEANFAEELGEQHEFNNNVRYVCDSLCLPNPDHSYLVPLRGHLMITMTENFVSKHLDDILEGFDENLEQII
jgi:hypothetical protein